MADNKRSTEKDSDIGKGAVEQDRPGQKDNVAPLSEQLDHQYQDALNKMSDTNFPEPGQNPEHSGEPQGENQLDRDTGANASGSTQRDPDGNNPESLVQDQDPGNRQKQNQNKKKDDDLAA